MFEHNAISILFQGNNFLRLLKGLGVTLEISLFSALFSIPLGVLFGMFMRRKGMVSRVLSRLYLDFIRIMPQLVLLFIVYFGSARAFAVNFSGEVASVFVFLVVEGGSHFICLSVFEYYSAAATNASSRRDRAH